MSNFDLRKFLAESKLHEEVASTEEAMDKPSTKMKMSELKKKIRQEILAELTLSEDNEIDLNISDPDKEYDFLDEATKDGDGKVPSKDADTDIEDIKDKEEVDIKVEKKPKAGPSGDFLDQLEDLKNEADDMGDNKLERQIDNTITYFTRQHIAKDTNESIELEEADNELEENLTKDQIQKKYNEMFGKNPQTKFADVAKALNTTEQEIAAALFFTPMFEADELKEADKDYYDAAERDDAAHIAALERDMEDDKRSAMRNESLKTKTTINENLTPLQQYVYDYEVEISGEDLANDELENIKNLKNVDDVYNYYASYRGWEQDRDFQYDLKRLYRTLVKKFPKTAMNESLEILKMKKLAGLLTEGEYAKALLREDIEQDIAIIAKPKIKDLMLEPRTEMIDGVLHIDFDDIGNLWSEVFEEVFKREMNDHIDQDVDDFEKVQDIVMGMISNNGEIEYEFDY